MNNNYTEEQIKDIQERVSKVESFLKENEIVLAAQVKKVNIGLDIKKDIFADEVVVFLRDTKYLPKEGVVSPLSEEMSKDDKGEVA